MRELRDSAGKRVAKVLIVEDDSMISFYMRNMLEANGHVVTGVVESGEEMFDAIHADGPDVILMDIMLKGKMDGVDAAERVSGEHGIPVIFVTANTDPSILRRAENTFPYGYVSKPFNEHELVSTIKAALYKHGMEKALLESERKYRTLFEHMSDAFIYLEAIIDSSGGLSDARIADVNEAFVRNMNLPREELVGKPLTEVFDNLDGMQSDWRGLLRAALDDTETHKFKVYFRRTDRWLGISAYSATKGYIGILAEDITKTVKYQKRLEESDKKLRAANREMNNLLLSIDSILIGVSTRDEVTHWNIVAERVFGIEAGEVTGKKINEIPIKWDWDDIFEGISVCIHKNAPVVLNDIHYDDNDGGRRYLGITINPIRDELGALNGFLIYGRDITKKRMIETQLLQDQKLKSIGELAAGIAHEINTPTQYVINNLHFLKDSFTGLLDICRRLHAMYGPEGENGVNRAGIEEIFKKSREMDVEFLMEEIPQAIEQSLEGLGRVSNIVKSMKSFSHPDREAMSPADLNKIIEDTITIARNEWKYVADVETRLDENLPEIRCHPAGLSQVVLNLLVNSAHAIKEAVENGSIEKGLITVSSYREEDTVVMKVEDNGTGIAEEIKHRVFDPFFTTKDVGLGTGQGLAISRSIIVDNHGGTIECESKKGEGTAFIVRLLVDPARRAEER